MPPFAIADVPAELAWSCPPGTTLVVPTQGMTADVAFAGDVVLKRCEDPRYVAWLRREYAVLTALAGADLLIPRVLGYADRGGEYWLAMTRLPGIALSCAAADSAARAALARALGTMLRRIHSTPIPAALHLEQPWIDRMLGGAEANLSWCDGTPEELADLRARRPASAGEVLIHGDLGLDNVLVSTDCVTGVIDWPMGGAGDPRMDVALALHDVFGADATATAAFYDGYGAAPLDRAARDWFEKLYDFY